jgi:ribonucleoside-triphosphate reductase
VCAAGHDGFAANHLSQEKMMESTRTLAEIESDIARVKEELNNVKGNETEVYARIVGYYRSVRNWNRGKKDEFAHRKEFVMTDSCCAKAPLPRRKGADFSAMSAALAQKISAYEFYSRKTCPKCPAVRDYIASSALKGESIDVDTDAGFAKAEARGVRSAPTVILFNASGAEVARAHNTADLAAFVAREAIAV